MHFPRSFMRLTSARSAPPASAAGTLSTPSTPPSDSAAQPTKFPIRGYHGHSTAPFANQAELDHGNWTAVCAGNPHIQLHQPPPPNTTHNKMDSFWFFPGPTQGNCVVQVIGLNQFRFKFWFSWSTRIFQNPARVSFTEPARARRQDEMQPVPVIPCREETTARVDVLRRQPHAGRWER